MATVSVRATVSVKTTVYVSPWCCCPRYIASNASCGAHSIFLVKLTVLNVTATDHQASI